MDKMDWTGKTIFPTKVVKWNNSVNWVHIFVDYSPPSNTGVNTKPTFYVNCEMQNNSLAIDDSHQN